mmetsp:Transcript_8790/g.14258  ORF Transcript_8790/g.14258 Transcript_8790/m.14258 type:complete len:211 (-) Transcript_8790:2929-3561(-)
MVWDSSVVQPHSAGGGRNADKRLPNAKRQLLKRPFEIELEGKRNTMVLKKIVDSAGIYCAESRLSTVSSRKKVKFADGTKTYSGLRADRFFYDELIYRFFCLGKEFSALDVLRLVGVDTQLIGQVNELLIDLCKRIKAAVESKKKDDGVPILLCGGGHGIKVGGFHLPYLSCLQRVVAEAQRVSAKGMNTGQNQNQTESIKQQQNILVAV